MATTYHLTTTDSDGPLGSNFGNTLEETAPATTTLGISVLNLATENDFGYTLANNPGSFGGSGARNYTVTVVNAGANNDLQLSTTVARTNSAGTVQTESGATAEQTASAGALTFTHTSVDLGTFGATDRFRVKITARDTSTMLDESLDYDIGSAGTRVEAPWTMPITYTKTGVGILGLVASGPKDVTTGGGGTTYDKAGTGHIGP